jgi:acetolactate synthase-1/3 small subunit
MRHIISVILENEAGALSRVSGLFTQRGFNIESLTVAITNDPSLSRMTIVSSGSDRVLEQIVKQLNKLIEVVKVSDLTSQDHVERELMLVKISSNLKDGVDLKELTEIFGCKVVDVTDKIYTIEVSGKTKKINAFLDAFDSANIIEVSRTGVTGISRGKKTNLIKEKK